MGQPLETVRIAWDNDLGYSTINKKDFNESLHVFYDDTPQLLPEPEVEAPDSLPASAALTLINNAAEVSDLEVLPGIGPSSATAIFAARPDNGYESLDVVAAIDGLFSGIDWDAVASWESV